MSTATPTSTPDGATAAAAIGEDDGGIAVGGACDWAGTDVERADGVDVPHSAELHLAMIMRPYGCVDGCVNPAKGLHHTTCPRWTDPRDVDADSLYIREGNALLAKLNVQPTTSLFTDCDAIYRDPITAGTVYVGNIKAAGSLAILQSHNITRVVNCQAVSSRNLYEGKGKGVSYYRFPIAPLAAKLIVASRKGDNHTESVLTPLGALFKFIDDSVSAGESVLIHCLAGAHRAGTTGVCYIMHKCNLEASLALTAAKRCRRVIDPIGHLQDFLLIYESARLAPDDDV
eukprot:m.59529 g.59529  ORF g.59529 m.59529 type:complete len:287 (-) comp17346_c1_seq1:170-1030(-)